MGETRRVDGALYGQGTAQGECTGFASIFALEKSDRLYMLVRWTFIKKRAGRLEEYLWIQHFIQEICHDNWLLMGARHCGQGVFHFSSETEAKQL